MFFIIFMSLLALTYGYVGWRIIVPFHLPIAANIAIWSLLVFLWVLPPLPWFMRSMGFEKSTVSMVAWIGYIGLGFIALIIFITLFRDLGWLGFSAYRKIASFFTAKESPVSDPAKRQFIIQAMNLGILGLTGGAVGYGLYAARRKPSIVNTDVPIKNLPKEFDGFRIVQFSDLHVGPTIKKGFVETVVAQIEQLNADLIAFTGDLVDGSVPDLSEDVAPIERLKAPFGKYFITGNHEYYSGVLPWLKKAKDLGFKVLIDEHDIISKDNAVLTLAGVTDYSSKLLIKGHNSDPIKALEGAPQESIKILLAHQPLNIYKASAAGYHLQLSGHTHGGQFIPWNFFTRLFQPYIAGLSKHKNTWIYVNRGTGYWGPPLRLGVRSEITVVTLTQA